MEGQKCQFEGLVASIIYAAAFVQTQLNVLSLVPEITVRPCSRLHGGYGGQIGRKRVTGNQVLPDIKNNVSQ